MGLEMGLSIGFAEIPKTNSIYYKTSSSFFSLSSLTRTSLSRFNLDTIPCGLNGKSLYGIDTNGILHFRRDSSISSIYIDTYVESIFVCETLSNNERERLAGRCGGGERRECSCGSCCRVPSGR